jgi:hypothetical protein
MTTCPDCGSPWSGTLSCPECARKEREQNSPQVAIDLGGASFVTPAIEPANEPWRCENCGKENRGDRNHCWSCSTTKGSRGTNGGRTVLRRPGICSHCLAMVDADAKFCPSCATPVSSDATCPNCGKSLNPSAKFCKYCAAAVPGHSVAAAVRPETSYTDALERQREKADRLTQGGIATAIISALLFAWGYYYTSSFANAGRAVIMNLAGQTDSTYQLAQWCITLGAIGFIVGLVLLIVGLAQR